MAKKVVLAGACRTAIGKMGGALEQYSGSGAGINRNQRGIEQSWRKAGAGR